MVAGPRGTPGFTWSSFPGETLAERLRQGPLPVDTAAYLITRLAQGLDVIHRNGLLHGGLRPEAVYLVDPEVPVHGGRALLLGHALYRLRPPPDIGRRASIDRLIHAAPEQVDRRIHAHWGSALTGPPPSQPAAESDVFLLGALLYECLTGRPAFLGTEVELVLEKLAQLPVPLSANPAIHLGAELAGELMRTSVGAQCRSRPPCRVKQDVVQDTGVGGVKRPSGAVAEGIRWGPGFADSRGAVGGGGARSAHRWPLSDGTCAVTPRSKKRSQPWGPRRTKCRGHAGAAQETRRGGEDRR